MVLTVTVEDLSGRAVADALESVGYERAGERGDHIVLRYAHPRTGTVRAVTVPDHDRLATEMLRNVAEQAGAVEFETFRDRIEAATD